MGHSATDSLNGRSSLYLSLSKENRSRMADTAETTTATTEVPVAETSAEAEAVPEVASNGAAAEKEETNGEAAKETTEAETTNGSTEEEETTSEAVKRKVEDEETKEEEGSAEKIAKLKEVAAEKLNEAEEKLPAEPLTEAEAVA